MEIEILENRKKIIMDMIQAEEYTPMKESEIAYLLGITGSEKQDLSHVLKELEEDGRLMISRRGKVLSIESQHLIRGTFQANPKGFGFVVPDDGFTKDIFIPADGVKGAMTRDVVLCRIVKSAKQDTRAEGEIVKVISRGLNTIVGRFERSRNFSFVIPDDKKIGVDIYISNANSMNAVSGHKVVVKIIKPASDREKNPEGKVVEVLGHINEPGVDVLSVIKQFELPLSFNEKVLAYTNGMALSVEEQQTENRTDLRHLLTVTIDNEDAKDLDDAITIEGIDGGGYRLGVHIADVAEYVKENSPLDKEALKRGTSVYLADRVIPMLPVQLSNGICSLNAGEDRLSLSCLMDIDAQGNVTAHEIAETVIHVNKRLTYNYVCGVIDNGYEDKGAPEIAAMIKIMDELCDILKEKRILRGALEFGFNEAKVVLNQDGDPIDIIPYGRNKATGMIEEFMLVCNETVAEAFFWLEAPFVYRSHEVPDKEKMESLSQFVHHFGYTFRGKSGHPKSIQSLLSNFDDTPEQLIISRVVLRSLKQARYTYENGGHFGLAAKYYCHFTSPIRRYPDLQIHRIIKDHLHGRLENKAARYHKILPEICRQTSAAERIAEEAEREVLNLKKVQFMADKIGGVFEGVISGVTSWGLFVELPNTVEGMVSLESIEDDYYHFDQKNMQVIGERFGRVFKLGQNVSVTLVRADLSNRRLDFVFAEE